MGFLESVRRARSYLEVHERVSLRALKREFELDEDALDELVEELVDVQRVATREGEVLAWSGATLPPAPATAPCPDPSERDPVNYTPKHLADKILKSKVALEGERKQVTVLFGDVKGSMALAEKVGPEEWHCLLDRFFQILTEGVHRFEGTVNQYTGDGIMALFGAPIAHEDHAQRCCYAALHIRDALEDYEKSLEARGLDFATRIGINTGDVVVGRIGDDLRMDYTAQGHTVGLAQRMEAMAAPHSVCVSEATARLVSGYVDLRSLGTISVKGCSQPVQAFALEGIGRHMTRLDVARSRGLTRFVGRDADVKTIEMALEQSLKGDGQVVGVVAEAGMGKSRLCLEFVERCRQQGIGVMEGHCPAHGKTVPYLPVLEMFRSAFDIAEHDDEREARRKITDELLSLDESFQDFLPLIFDFLGVNSSERPTPELSSDARQRHLLAFVGHYTRARSARESQVFFIDDAHWIDTGSDAFLGHAIKAARGTPTLWLINFRPGYRADWMRHSNYRQISLLPLRRQATGKFLSDLLGQPPSSTLATRIFERTDGNPFFIEEVVLSLVESGYLEGTRGAYRLVAPIEDLKIPDTVQNLLAARIDRLSEREKQLLQTAAVIDKKFSKAVLRLVTTLPEKELTGSLSALVEGDFLFEKALYPEAKYAFKHPLTHETAYDSQLEARRAKMHAAVARAVETVDAGRLDERAALLAHHWERSDDTVKAVQWHARAARHCAADNTDGSLRHWLRVRAMLEERPDVDDATALRLEAATCALNLGWRLGMKEEEARTILEEGKNLALESGDLDSHVRLLEGYTIVHTSGGDPMKVRDLAVEALALAKQSGEPELEYSAYEGVVDFHFFTGNVVEAVRLCEEAVELVDTRLEPGSFVNGIPASWSNAYHAWILIFRGHLDEADVALHKYRDETRGLPYTETESWADCVRSLRRFYGRDTQGALMYARRAVESAERVGSNLAYVWAHHRFGAAFRAAGNWNAAIDHLTVALSVARETRSWLTMEADILADLAEARLGAGETHQAQLLAHEAIDAARRRTTPLWEAQAHLSLARVLRSRFGTSARREIQAALDSCLSISEQTQARIFEPYVEKERSGLSLQDRDSRYGPGRLAPSA